MASIVFGKGIKTIPEYAFAECSSLTAIEIPSNIEHIEKEAFSGCSSLSSLTFNEGLKDIGDGAFYFYNSSSDEDVSVGTKAKLTSLVLPDSLTTLGKNCFASQDALTDVTFGSGLTNIGVSAFADCPLTSLSLSASNKKLSVENNILYDYSKTKAIFSLPNLQGSLNLPSTLTEIEP